MILYAQKSTGEDVWFLLYDYVVLNRTDGAYSSCYPSFYAAFIKQTNFNYRTNTFDISIGYTIEEVRRQNKTYRAKKSRDII